MKGGTCKLLRGITFDARFRTTHATAQRSAKPYMQAYLEHKFSLQHPERCLLLTFHSTWRRSRRFTSSSRPATARFQCRRHRRYCWRRLLQGAYVAHSPSSPGLNPHRWYQSSHRLTFTSQFLRRSLTLLYAPWKRHRHRYLLHAALFYPVSTSLGKQPARSLQLHIREQD